MFDRRDLGAERVHTPIAHINAIHLDDPTLRIVDAVDQVGQARLPRASLPDNRDCLACIHSEVDVLEHPLAVVAKADPLKLDLSPHGLRVSLDVLIKLGGGINHLQYPAGACHAKLDQVKRIQGNEGGKPKPPEKPDVSHDLPEGKLAVQPDRQRVEHTDRPEYAEGQHRPVSGLDLAVFYEEIPVPSGVVCELVEFVLLEHVRLDYLDTRDRLGQAGVHGAKLLPHCHCDRAKTASVVPHSEN